ncbi:MAG: M1 family metallopeptidase [Chloroflexi bacterium]|nr:M1 family metallopeptidase [Chloroflexota bacterium]
MTTSYRLPGNILPTKYDLTLTPNLTDFTFSGDETISIEVTETTDRIAINAIDLEVVDARITLEDGTSLTAKDIALDEESETATFSFGQSIPVGTAALHIGFTGTLNDQLRGFYRSQYTNPEGKEQYLATTQFEATDARRAFPCWDDPAVKATFQVTLVIPLDLVAISNTLVESETPQDDNTKVVRFAETPRMSTYLLAFIVGDFASVEQRAPNGTLVRVWATRGKEEQGRFALENAVGLLSYLNDYFGIPYPQEKLDHIAIPDFAAGAMENWGAITYRETALLYDPKNSSANTKQRIMEVVAHEMAHMWFGDLVTMEWWDDLWLNESFASWMGDKAVDHQYPEWHMWTQFVYQDTNSGLSLDGLRNSHPIEAKVEDPAQIRELFDAISYSKGGAVLRMLEDFLGPEAFQRGLHGYLSAHQYGNARTEDLWAALEEASGQPVTTVMNSWVKQMGYPFLQVKAELHDSNLHIGLSQHRFLYDHLMEQDGDDKTLWQVPVSITQAGNDKKVSILMEQQETEVSLAWEPSLDSSDWVKVNAGQTGFYRVNYQAEEWEKLRSAVEKQQLPAIDRLGIQNDAYALARAGHLPATQFLSLAESYKGETDSSVWSDLATNLRGMENLVQDQPLFPQFRNFAGALFQQIAEQVGWDAKPGEGHLDSLLRTTVLGQAGSYGDPQVLAEAKTRFARFLNEPSSVHPDLRGLVYSLTAQEGDRSTYDALWELEKKAGLHEERMRLLGALTRFHQKDILQDVLERSMSTEVRSQDSVLVVISVAGNRHGKELAWEFIKANWDELDGRYGRGGFAIMRLVSVTGAFTTQEKAQEVEEFFRDHPAPSAQRTIQQSLERIRLNVKWLESNRQGLEGWFASRG